MIIPKCSGNISRILFSNFSVSRPIYFWRVSTEIGFNLEKSLTILFSHQLKTTPFPTMNLSHPHMFFDLESTNRINDPREECLIFFYLFDVMQMRFSYVSHEVLPTGARFLSSFSTFTNVFTVWCRRISQTEEIGTYFFRRWLKRHQDLKRQNEKKECPKNPTIDYPISVEAYDR